MCGIRQYACGLFVGDLHIVSLILQWGMDNTTPNYVLCCIQQGAVKNAASGDFGSGQKLKHLSHGAH